MCAALPDAAAPPQCSAPLQLSALRQLRILYLHGIAYGEEPMAPQDFEPLRACTALAFLSISRNLLRELPPAVADMPHLQVSGSCLVCRY